MRDLIFLTAFFLVYSAPATAGDSDELFDRAEACLSCHKVVASLTGRGASVIADQMKAIRAGEKDHAPGLADLTDEEIAEIAAFLDGA